MAETPTCPKCGKWSYKLQTEAQCGACGHVLFHFVCPTCEGERERGCGHGKGLRERTLKSVPAGYEQPHYCCACGACTEPAAIFDPPRLYSSCRDEHEAPDPELLDD